jgi:hypothetical protein
MGKGITLTEKEAMELKKALAERVEGYADAGAGSEATEE